ncbi:MAG TPA: DUF3667 domain-containing protein [Steroidobacteraceae bacterium]
MEEPVLPRGAAAPVAAGRACANCGTITAGNYCSHCGQRLDTQLHSVGHFLRDATEVMTHADARVWRTLLPLLTRPGFLTREYFAGRRARYLQPFRLYVILSIVFFLMNALLGSHHEIAGLKVGGDVPRPCANVHTDLPGAAWLQPRFVTTCKRIYADGGRAFSESVVHNLGRGMFVFLPLLAGLMKLLYWRPPRFYLEHLLLLIHNHAFVFLLLSMFMLATHWLSSTGWNTFFSLVLTGYLGRYLYRSMKTMYGQAGWLTLLKFSALGFAYLVCGLVMLVAATLITAATP